MKMKWFLLFFLPAATLLSASILLSGSKSYVSSLFSPANLPNIGLFVAGVIGICVAIRTLKAINRQAAIMARQTRIAEESSNAAKESIILTHRPKIIVRSAVMAWKPILDRGLSITDLNRSNFDEGQLAGFFHAVNIGNQPAKICSLEKYAVFFQLPMERPYESGCEKESVSISLKPGESVKIPFTPKAVSVHPDYYNARISTHTNFYMIGRLSYVDDMGNARETGFARQLNYNSGRFTPIEDLDYEYAD
jgi:hypothetical protein